MRFCFDATYFASLKVQDVRLFRDASYRFFRQTAWRLALRIGKAL